MNVEKRDGTIQPFDFKKIEIVIKKVFDNKAVNSEIPDGLVDSIRVYFDNLISKQDGKDPNYAMPIEKIQDIIRDFLMRKHKKAAEEFVKYRAKREEAREKKSWFSKEIKRKLSGNDVENQNANLDEASFGGRIGEAARVVTKDYALKNCMSKTTRKNHEENISYVHDLDSYAVGMHNCDSIPFDKLLADGFNTRQTDVRGAGSVYTAMQLVAVIFQLQSLQQFGGVSATHFDWSMVPYVRESFYKHFIDGLKYIEGFSEKELNNFEKTLCDDINGDGDD